MLWAKGLGYERVITSPVDTPFLPADFVITLSEGHAPVYCRRNGSDHFLHGVWPVDLEQDLAAFVADGGRAMKDWLKHCGARVCDFGQSDDTAPFFNVNTQEDLKALEAILKRSSSALPRRGSPRV